MASVAKAKLIRSQLEGLCNEPVHLSSKEDIDREITPILPEFFMVNSWNDDHPTAKKLFVWLLEEHRSVEEFI